MLHANAKDFIKALPDKSRIMGLDMGLAKIGIAFTDLKRSFSTPHSVYKRTKDQDKDIEYIFKCATENESHGIVIGIPTKSDGSLTKISNAFLIFTHSLVDKYEINAFLQDENFSTQLAREMLEESHLSRRKKQMLDDKIAASIILQDFISNHNLGGTL